MTGASHSGPKSHLRRYDWSPREWLGNVVQEALVVAPSGSGPGSLAMHCI